MKWSNDGEWIWAYNINLMAWTLVAGEIDIKRGIRTGAEGDSE